MWKCTLLGSSKSGECMKDLLHLSIILYLYIGRNTEIGSVDPRNSNRYGLEKARLVLLTLPTWQLDQAARNSASLVF